MKIKQSIDYITDSRKRSQKIKELTKQLKEARQHQNFDEITNLLHQRGNLYRQAELLDDALKDHQDEVRTSEKYSSHDKKGLSTAYKNLIEVYLVREEEERAIELIEKYLAAAMQAGKREEHCARIQIGRVHLAIGDKIRDFEYFFIKEEKVRRLDNYLKAKTAFMSAYEILNNSGLRTDKAMLCATLLNIGLVHSRQEKYAESIEFTKKALEAAERGHVNQYRCYRTLSECYLGLKDYEKLKEEAINMHNVGRVNGVSEMKMEPKLFFESKAEFLLGNVKRGLDILKKTRKTLIEAGAHYSQELSRAEDKMIAAIRIIRLECRLGEPDIKISEKKDLFERLADNYVTLENYDKAIECYHQAIQFAESLGQFCSVRNKAALYASLAMTYRDNCDFENAIKYFKIEMCRQQSPKEMFQSQSQVAFCKFRATEVHGSKKYTKAEIINDNRIALDLAFKGSNMETQQWDALMNLRDCYEFYEMKPEYDEVVKKLNSWSAQKELTKEKIDSLRPAGQTTNERTDDIVDLDDLSSVDESEHEEPAVPRPSSASRKTATLVAGPSRKRRRTFPQTHVTQDKQEQIPSRNFRSTRNNLRQHRRRANEPGKEIDGAPLGIDFLSSTDSAASLPQPQQIEELIHVDNKVDQPQINTDNVDESISPERSGPNPIVEQTTPLTSGVHNIKMGVTASTATIPALPHAPAANVSHGADTFQSPNTNILHIRVEMNGNKILISLRRNEWENNVEWLRQQCCLRFQRQYRLPNVHIDALATPDGAILFDLDTIDMVTRGVDACLHAIKTLDSFLMD